MTTQTISLKNAEQNVQKFLNFKRYRRQERKDSKFFTEFKHISHQTLMDSIEIFLDKKF